MATPTRLLTLAKPLIWLLAIAAWPTSRPDLAIVMQFQKQNSKLDGVQILHRAPAEGDLELVVAMGGPRRFVEQRTDGQFWQSNTAIGLFLQRRDQPGMVYQLTIEQGSGNLDCYSRLERVASNDVVFSCAPEKG